MASASSPLRKAEPANDEIDDLLHDPEVLCELGRLADEADADGGRGDMDGAAFVRDFMAETLQMAAARGLPTT